MTDTSTENNFLVSILNYYLTGRDEYDDNNEDGYEVEDVDHEQPFSNRGIFYVNLEKYGSVAVRLAADAEWIVVDE